ncbi:HIT domain-containing protein [Peptacetobacter sp.]|uniref:HIT domain-containing protein n=1 Tax=unclassified Peptacetobacter TaxID=2991974 RepID=UPI002E76C81C|nr:HIT domain-containing protein [Peptacetobacter sp.]MEE0451045.1 hypothetical protein [Peptacetobacter sp.]
MLKKKGEFYNNCDKFPATKGYILFIQKIHIANFFDLTKEEREVIFDLGDEGKNY